MNPKVSVIVPVYNAEKYLARCLNSIAVQTMPDFECIIVDDGSTDQTGVIADAYSSKDSRFRVIHQKNGGVAIARQTGIDAAIGVYTIQFDADDWVEVDMLEKLLFEAEKNGADMVICDFYYRESAEEGETKLSQMPISLDPKVVLGQMMHDLLGSLCNKLIRRDCYDRYDIQFIPGMLSEDQYVCLRLLAHSITIAYIPSALYHYDRTQNPQSLVNNGIPPADRLKPLELITSYVDLTNIQDYYDRAIILIAYEALFFSKEKCPNYRGLFKKHLSSVYRVKGFPIRVKILVILRTFGIRIPIYSIKKMFGKYRKKEA